MSTQHMFLGRNKKNSYLDIRLILNGAMDLIIECHIFVWTGGQGLGCLEVCV